VLGIVLGLLLGIMLGKKELLGTLLGR